MRLKITHLTQYSYDEPVTFGLLKLRMRPQNGISQNVEDWNYSFQGGAHQVDFIDHFGNQTDLFRLDSGTLSVQISAEGLVETEDRSGVVGKHKGPAPLWVFEAETEATKPGAQMRTLIRDIRAATADLDSVARLHHLSEAIGEAVEYQTGETNSKTSAETALTEGRGVCQDHAHIMIGTARALGYPARYVSGYLMMNDRVDQEASHAWCEVYTDALGWVGFDVSNGYCPDERYVRIAYGRDYADAAPIVGIRQGPGNENLQVSLQIQQ